jgi:hypothetical protein
VRRRGADRGIRGGRARRRRPLAARRADQRHRDAG